MDLDVRCDRVGKSAYDWIQCFLAVQLLIVKRNSKFEILISTIFSIENKN